MVTAASGAARRVDAPGVLGLEEVLQGAPATCAVHAKDAAACFRIPAGEFLTSVSNNVLLAQGLFRMLLQGVLDVGELALTSPAAAEPPLQQFDQALQLRQHPLLSRASPAQLVALIAAGREVPLADGAVLFDADAPAAIFQVLAGGLLIESPALGPRIAGPGTAINVAATLAGGASGYRAVVTHAGRALRLDRDDLFAVLTDDVELMQGLFSDVLAYREALSALPEAAVTAAGTRG
jgi:hypothetical protein